MTVWNFDMSAAPKGKPIKVTRKVRTSKGVEDRQIDEIQPVNVMIASTDGNVYQSRWLGPTHFTPSGRWAGFPADAKTILAWAPWPEHPGAAPKLHTAAADVVAHLYLEDVGGGQ